MTIQRQSNRSFGLMFGAALIVLTGILWLLFGTLLMTTLIAAAAFVVFALLAPGLLLPLNRIWAAFGARLGWLNNHVVLGLFFFLLMTPMAVVMRLFGWDPMKIRRRRDSSSGYWVNVGRDAEPDTFKDMF